MRQIVFAVGNSGRFSLSDSCNGPRSSFWVGAQIMG
jgi:hypothetical protein